jgi:starch phosphorylase
MNESGGRGKVDISLFEQLVMVAENLRYTWHQGARSYFARLFPEASVNQLEWPLELLRSLGGDEVLRRLDRDPELAQQAAELAEDRVRYLAEAAETWYPSTHPGDSTMEVAYFAAEFALSDSLPIYAGGLGAIAAEQLKSASALGLPLIGVGLLYRETSHQHIDALGIQQELWETLETAKIPVVLVRDSLGHPSTVQIPFPGRNVLAQIWTAPVGRNRIVLLDTALKENDPEDRGITNRLYGGDLRTRISQELVLGVGGLRALRLLGHHPSVVHINEGHTAFAGLELVAELAEEHSLNFDEAMVLAASKLIFTTHTPVAAGHDYFPAELASEYLAPYAELLGIELEHLLSLGRYRPDDPLDSFCPTVLALRLSDVRNGVSRLHGQITREQWSGLWPRVPFEEVPIKHVTNGVHLQSWISAEIDELLDHQLGGDWRTKPGDPATWARLLEADDTLLWGARASARRRLVESSRLRRGAFLRARGASAAELDAASRQLDPEALTIGFVGRFVAYKRPNLFLHDPDRLAALLSDPQRPVQIVFGGMAHPNDEQGKQLLRSVLDFSARFHLEDRICFIEDFDMPTDRSLSQGVDVWLNNPRRPLEACGIGGMKSGANGALNLSTLDGWWDEVWNDADPKAPPIGWTIGTASTYVDVGLQDDLDAESFYATLEDQIVPTFFERDADGIPRAWLASIRQSMATLAPTWHSHRMVQQYVEDAYQPALTRSARLENDYAARTRGLAERLRHWRRWWSALELRLASVEAKRRGSVLVRVELTPGAISTDELTVQLWLIPPSLLGYAVPCRLVGGGPTRWSYEAEIPSLVAATATMTARAMPSHPDLPKAMLPGLIAWTS